MREMTKRLIESYIDSICPIIYIHHSDFVDVVKELKRAAHSDMRFVEFNNALGVLNFEDKHPMQQCTLAEFLTAQMDDGFDDEHECVFVLKDVHRSLNEDSQVDSPFTAYSRTQYQPERLQSKSNYCGFKDCHPARTGELYHSC